MKPQWLNWRQRLRSHGGAGAAATRWQVQRLWQWLGQGRNLWRGWAWVLALGCVLLLLATGRPPAPSSNAPAQPVPDLALAQALPAPLTVAALTDAALQLQEFPWGAEARKPLQPKAGGPAGKGAEAPALRWGIAGSFVDADGQRRLLLQFENDKQPPQYLRPGASLPDGRQLWAIERFEALVSPAGQGQDQAQWQPWGQLASDALPPAGQ